MAETVEQPSWKKGLAELIGTFTLIYVGILVLTLQGGRASLVEVAFAHGLALAVMVSATMHISGGQLNPAVTLGLLSIKKISPSQAGVNILFQLVGAVSAGYLAWASVGYASSGGVPVIVGGVPDLAAGVTIGRGILVEAILTFFLMFVVMGTLVDSRFGGRIGGLGVGLVVAMDILAGGPITGAAMNPARWFGAALAASHTANAIVYLVGPILGAVVAAFTYKFAFLNDAQKN